MSLFCLLWMPLFYLLRRSLTENDAGSGGVWALLLGSVVALVQFFLGNLVSPGGFGISRWVSAWVDIVTMPALLPLLVYLLLIIFKVLSGPFDFANFALLWLIPGAAIRAVSWSAGGNPTLLVLAPLLWTAIACGIPFFINLILDHFRWYVVIPSGLAILIIPFSAATSWWAFYSQMLSWGFLFFFVAVIPTAISFLVSWVRVRG